MASSPSCHDRAALEHRAVRRAHPRRGRACAPPRRPPGPRVPRRGARARRDGGGDRGRPRPPRARAARVRGGAPPRRPAHRRARARRARGSRGAGGGGPPVRRRDRVPARRGRPRASAAPAAPATRRPSSSPRRPARTASRSSSPPPPRRRRSSSASTRTSSSAPASAPDRAAPSPRRRGRPATDPGGHVIDASPRRSLPESVVVCECWARDGLQSMPGPRPDGAEDRDDRSHHRGGLQEARGDVLLAPEAPARSSRTRSRCCGGIAPPARRLARRAHAERARLRAARDLPAGGLRGRGDHPHDLRERAAQPPQLPHGARRGDGGARPHHGPRPPPRDPDHRLRRHGLRLPGRRRRALRRRREDRPLLPGGGRADDHARRHDRHGEPGPGPRADRGAPGRLPAGGVHRALPRHARHRGS